MVAAHVNILTRMESGTTLADEDIAGDRRLATVHFDAKAFTFTVAAVVGTTRTFFMCHDSNSILKDDG